MYLVCKEEIQIQMDGVAVSVGFLFHVHQGLNPLLAIRAVLGLASCHVEGEAGGAVSSSSVCHSCVLCYSSSGTLTPKSGSEKKNHEVHGWVLENSTSIQSDPRLGEPSSPRSLNVTMTSRLT